MASNYPIVLIESSLRRAEQLFAKGEQLRAARLYARALRDLRRNRIRYPSLEARITLNLGFFYRLHKRPAKARKLLTKACQIYDSLPVPDTEGHAVALHELADIHFAEGRHRIAARFYTSALRTYMQLPTPPQRWVQVCDRLMEIYCQRAHPERAYQQYLKVLENVLPNLHQPEAASAVKSRIAWVLLLQGKTDQAIKTYLQQQ